MTPNEHQLAERRQIERDIKLAQTIQQLAAAINQLHERLSYIESMTLPLDRSHPAPNFAQLHERVSQLEAMTHQWPRPMEPTP